MTDSNKLQYNTRERLTSTDLNGNITRQSYSVQEAMQTIGSPDQGRSGVISGLNVTIDAAVRTATVSAGLGVYYDQTNNFPESKSRWVEVLTSATVALPAATGFDQWTVIEIAPGTTAFTTEIRDIWDPTIPPSGNFTPSSVPKDIRSDPTVSARTGPDGAPNPPHFPDGTTGVMPLAYVFMDAAGVVFGGIDGIVMCRPILRTPSSTDVQMFPARTLLDERTNGWVNGGGINSSPSSDTCTLNFGITGVFPGSGIGWKVNAHTVDATDPTIFEANTIPAIDSMLYAYAIAPPYQSGYDSILADREFAVGSLVSSKFATASNASTYNCCVLMSTSPPNEVSGPIGSDQGVVESLDWPFRTGLTGSGLIESRREHWIYLGAVNYDFVNTKFIGQDYIADGLVGLTERIVYINFKEVGNGTYPLHTSSYTVPPPSVFEGKMPPFARIYNGRINAELPAGGVPPGHSTFEINVSAGDGLYRYKEINVDAPVETIVWRTQMIATIGGDSTFTITPDPTTQTVAPTWFGITYIDPFIASR